MDYILSLLTFFLGLILGHWLAIGRDKRKEFNDNAVVLNSKLYDCIERDNTYFLPTTKELRLFTSYVPLYRRWIYEKRVKQLSESLQNDEKATVYDPIEETTITDSGYVSLTYIYIKKLQWHLRRI
jgi:predicted DNA-binding protein YlxM (UPF0122 family)